MTLKVAFTAFRTLALTFTLVYAGGPRRQLGLAGEDGGKQGEGNKCQ